jgi:hypothetical protein
MLNLNSTYQKFTNQCQMIYTLCWGCDFNIGIIFYFYYQQLQYCVKKCCDTEMKCYKVLLLQMDMFNLGLEEGLKEIKSKQRSKQVGVGHTLWEENWGNRKLFQTMFVVLLFKYFLIFYKNLKYIWKDYWFQSSWVSVFFDMTLDFVRLL